MQKDIAKGTELLIILILSFSPQLISLHNDSVTECIVGNIWGHFHYDFCKKLNNLRLPILFPLALSYETVI